MSIHRCASDCDCKWSFLHSYIVNTSPATKDGVITTRTFLVCGECKEWVGKPLRDCATRCRCHDEAWSEAETVEVTKLEVVDFL